ncbi:uncharacterized protein [Temnothorax nylanderi]|uniref:uncharacterized protein isoform X2 n=1 Tax=Temnothorax nylanderi TaxID=102681 RepID=UPI003A883FCC
MADPSDPLSKPAGNSRAPGNEIPANPLKRMRVEVTEQVLDSAFQKIMEGESTVDAVGQDVSRRGIPLPDGQRDETTNAGMDSPLNQGQSDDVMDTEVSNVVINSDTRSGEFFINKAVAVNSSKNIDDLVSKHIDSSNKEKVRDARSRDPSVPNVIGEDRESYSVHEGNLRKCSQQQLRPIITRFDSSFIGKAKITIKLPPDQTSARKGKNLIKIWMLLTNIRICPSSLEMLNHYSAEAEFTDYLEANLALEAIEKIPSKLKAFMEQRSMISKGVIADWPSSIKDLWSVIQDRSGIIGLERMYRRKWDSIEKKTTLSETDNIIVTFKGTGIRDLKIFTNNVGLKVRPFVPQTRQCFNCFSARRFVEGGDCVAPPADARTSEGSWPRLPSPRRASYTETACVSGENQGNRRTEASVLRPDYNRRFGDSEKRRAPSSKSSQDYYKQFNLRASDINKEKQGIMFASARNGAAWSNAISAQSTGDPPPVNHVTQVPQDIASGMMELLPLLKLLKELMERWSSRGGTSLDRILETDFLRELGFKTVQSGNVLNSGGASISVRRSIDFDVIPLSDDIPYGYDTVGIRTKNLNNNCNIMAVYRHPRGELTDADISVVVDQVPDTLDSIILGDFNAHNSTWNCDLTTPSGEALHDTLLDRGFFCINSDTKSRVGQRGQRDSNIDLAFGTAGVIDNVEYEQQDDAWDSDHYPISFTVDSDPQPYRKITNRITSKKTNWTSYYKFVDETIKRDLLPFIDHFSEDVDLYYGRFIDILRTSIDRASGRRKMAGFPDAKEKKHKVQHRWWDVDCDKVIQDRKKTFSTFKRCKSLSTWDSYKRACALVRRTIAAKKKACFEEFCAGINRFTSLSYVWNTIRILKNARNNVRWNSWSGKNREDEIRKSVDKLAPPFVGSDPVLNINYPDDSLSSLFRRSELDRAIKMIKKNSAPGLDGIEYKMIQELPDSALECLLRLFNCIWLSDSLPEDWHRYQVVFIDKPGKEKVRPISLSSCVGKLCERMINERLIWWAESAHKFNPSQNGFRRGKSCADNLVKIVSDIRTSISSGRRSQSCPILSLHGENMH